MSDAKFWEKILSFRSARLFIFHLLTSHGLTSHGLQPVAIFSI